VKLTEPARAALIVVGFYVALLAFAGGVALVAMLAMNGNN
jgi:hypothetical protein